MFRRILVAVDDPGDAARVVHVAERMAARTGASLVVSHVEPPAAPEGARDAGGVHRLAAELRERGVAAESAIEYARPEEGIARGAEREHADLIVMAPRGRAGLDALRHPSVTRRILARAPAPVLVWPEGLDPSADALFLCSHCSLIIAPLDGGELAERALPFAITFAREYGRTLLLLHVAPAPFPLGSGPTGRALAGETLKAEEVGARRYLGAVRERLEREAGIHVECMLKVGNPATEIARTAEVHPGSLIVMSTHGRGGLSRALLGSVAAEVIRRTPAPALIVPPAAMPPGGGQPPASATADTPFAADDA